MSGRRGFWLTAAALAALVVWLGTVVAGASASISGVSGQVSLIAAPASVQYGALESNNTVYAFDEQQCVALPADLPADITSPGTYHVTTDLTKGTLTAGMQVSSHFVHADQTGRLKPFTDYDGSITVDQPIVGIEVRKATLDKTDFLGAPGTLYPTGAFGRGLELKPTNTKADYITLAPDLRTVSFHLQVALHVDQIRVLTECAPPPPPKATIVVKKLTVPSGDPASFSFSGDLSGSIGDGGTLSAQVAPGTYTTSEAVPAGWSLTSISCDDPGSSGNLGSATATYSVAAGQTVTCTFTDTKANGTPLTIGYWKNWSSCGGGNGNQSPVLDDVLSKTGGIALSSVLTIKTCPPAVAILDKSTIDNGKKMSSDPAFNMAAQLLAAKLNFANGAKVCAAATSAVADGYNLLSAVGFTGLSTWSNTMSAAQKSSANSIEGILDSYNNNTLC